MHTRKTILIADDSELNREILAEILGDKYNYVYAEDGAQALDILAANMDIDILLLDMNMPKMDGMEVLRVMKERHWSDDLPIVIISAETDMEYIQKAYELGITDYITRPFNAFLVQHRVKNTLTLYSQKKRLVRLVESQVFQREKVNNMMINIFSHIVEKDNQESGKHTLHVQTITSLLLNNLVKITKKYHLTETDIAMISSVSALHDIGKITVPDEILNKPGKLNAEEWEIMKSHTVNGDKFLSEIKIDQTEKFMVTAHEICRWHHEKYDGKGYPDGLVGDEIPISAQAVSMADVYDALTSDRCYKKAFTHDQAITMILNGECGTFNPLLIRCLKDISDELFVNLNLNEDNNYDYEETVQTLATEAFESENLVVNERYSYVAESEGQKKEFFASRCHGIQFEYDAITRKILYMHYYNENGTITPLKDEAVNIFKDQLCKEIEEKVKKTTREAPMCTITARIPVNGTLRWHEMAIQSLWVKKRPTYIGVVGQFTDIHDKLSQKGAELLINGNIITRATFVAMQSIFDVVRLVNPCTSEVYNIDMEGNMIDIGEKCYNIWDRNEVCKNCSSNKALFTHKWLSKIEVKRGKMYAVLSKYVTCMGRDCVLEVAFCLDSSLEKALNLFGFCPDSMALNSFYRDTLTNTYSRAYLENFKQNLQNAKGVAMADIDRFKYINDTYGHIVGDEALKHVANIIRSCIRRSDLLIRYGGDEFVLIFNDISEENFYIKLESIKKIVHDSIINEYPHVKLDISIGGAYGVQPIMQAVAAADKEMYKDKMKNRKNDEVR